MTSKPSMYPSSRSTEAIPRQTLLLRQVTVLERFRTALRIRVSMSAIGSPIAIFRVLSPGSRSWVLKSLCLPARLAHTGDLALKGELPKHDAADAELAVDASRTPGQLTPTHNAGAELGLALRLGHLCLG